MKLPEEFPLTPPPFFTRKMGLWYIDRAAIYEICKMISQKPLWNLSGLATKFLLSRLPDREADPLQKSGGGKPK